MSELRRRGNRRFRVWGDVEALRSCFCHSLDPLMNHLTTVAGDALKDLSAQDFGDVVFECLGPCWRRTKLRAKFRPITESREQWRLVEQALQAYRGGDRSLLRKRGSASEN